MSQWSPHSAQTQQACLQMAVWTCLGLGATRVVLAANKRWKEFSGEISVNPGPRLTGNDTWLRCMVARWLLWPLRMLTWSYTSPEARDILTKCQFHWSTKDNALWWEKRFYTLYIPSIFLHSHKLNHSKLHKYNTTQTKHINSVMWKHYMAKGLQSLCIEGAFSPSLALLLPWQPAHVSSTGVQPSFFALIQGQPQ